MYIRGGYNLYPLEVEQVLSDHPEIAEVALAGVADDVLGAIGVAWVVPDPTSPASCLDPLALRHFVREQIADYKAPDRVVIVGGLPRNPMGKVDKKALLADLTATPGLKSP